MRRPASIVTALTVLLALLLPGHASVPVSAAVGSSSSLQGPALLARLQALPAAFEPNVGQLAARAVRFTARSGGSTLFLTDSEAVLATLQHPSRGTMPARATDASLQMEQAVLAHQALPSVTETVIRLRPLGTQAHPILSALQRLPGVINDYRGNDPKRWHTGIPTFARVVYRNLYPGIDLSYYGTGRGLEYDWILHPGANPARIRLSITGPGGLTLDRQGGLRLAGTGLRLLMGAPRIVQSIGGVRHAVAGRFRLTGPHTVSFQVGRYDHHRTLTIDPTFAVTTDSTYFGGTGDESLSGVRIDSQLHTIIEGDSTSATFPMGSQTSFQSPALSAQNLYVACISADLSAFNWVTRIGGKVSSVSSLPASTFGNALDLGTDDSVYVGGTTSATDIPQKNPFQQVNILLTGYVAKLSSGGQLMLASTVGGATGIDEVAALALNRSTGDLFLGLDTTSSDLPTQNGVVQPAYPKQQCPSGQGTTMVPCLAGFLMRITGITTAAVSARIPHAQKAAEANGTYLGATTSGNTFIHNLAVGPNNTVDVTGTAEANLPVSSGAFQTSGVAGGQTAYVGVFTSTFAAGQDYLSFAHPSSQSSNGNSLTVDGSDLIDGVNAFAPSGNNTKITGYVGIWPLAPSGLPSANPTFQTLSQLEPSIPSSTFSTYIADTRVVQGWNEQSDPFKLGGTPVEVLGDVIPTASGVPVAWEDVRVVGNHALTANAGIAPAVLNGGGKEADGAVVDGVYSAATGWHTRAGFLVSGSISGTLATFPSGAVASARVMHAAAPAAAAQGSYSGGADVYVLSLDRPNPSPAPVPTATAKPATKCPKNSSKKKGKCVCKKGYVKKKGKCVKKK